MKKATLLILAVSLLPGISFATDAACEYAPETVDPVGNEKIIRTTWQAIKQGDGSGMSFTRGYARGISEGNEKYLGLKIDVTHYRPIPPELGIKLEDTNIITKKGKFDPRLDPFVEELQKTAFTMPSGLALRLTLEDRTTLVISTTEDKSFLPVVTKPEWDSNLSPEYRLQYRVMPRYVLDADTIALLSNNLVVSLRMEMPYQDLFYKYYYFGHRNLIWDDKVISKKTMATIKGALKCVL